MPIEFKHKKINFTSNAGGPRKGSDTVEFDNPVWHVEAAAIKGFDIGFADTDHHFFRQRVDVNAVKSTDNPKYVTVDVTFGLRDSSGTYDDAYNGYVDVLVIAETETINLPDNIRGNDKVALRSKNGLYVSAEAGGGSKLIATKSTVGDEERFTVEIIDNLATSYLGDHSQIALRASNGKLVCAEEGGGRELVANRDEIGIWETFTVRTLAEGLTAAPLNVANGSMVALHTHTGQFVCAEDGGGREMVANRGRVGPWETFTIVRA